MQPAPSLFRNPPLHCRRLPRCGGFTYIGALILVALISLAATATVQLGSITERRAAEEELLAIGAEFRQALTSYARATPPGHKQWPSSLEDLLKDRRLPVPMRHLRKLYADPLTGKQEWGVILAPDGSGIVGIHSLSESRPIKIGNFEPGLQHFEDKSSYRQWVFTAAL